MVEELGPTRGAQNGSLVMSTAPDCLVAGLHFVLVSLGATTFSSSMVWSVHLLEGDPVVSCVLCRCSCLGQHGLKLQKECCHIACLAFATAFHPSVPASGFAELAGGHRRCLPMLCRVSPARQQCLPTQPHT